MCADQIPRVEAVEHPQFTSEPEYHHIRRPREKISDKPNTETYSITAEVGVLSRHSKPAVLMVLAEFTCTKRSGRRDADIQRVRHAPSNAATGGARRNGIYGSPDCWKTVLAGRASSQRTRRERVRRGPSNLEGSSLFGENLLLSEPIRCDPRRPIADFTQKMSVR